MNARSYLPVQQVTRAASPRAKGGGVALRTTFQFLAPVPANMTLLQPPVPTGFHRTPITGNPILP